MKWTGMVEIKHKDFIDAVPIKPCQNSLWIMDFRVNGDERNQIPSNPPATIDPLGRIQHRQGLY